MIASLPGNVNGFSSIWRAGVFSESIFLQYLPDYKCNYFKNKNEISGSYARCKPFSEVDTLKCQTGAVNINLLIGEALRAPLLQQN